MARISALPLATPAAGEAGGAAAGAEAGGAAAGMAAAAGPLALAAAAAAAVAVAFYRVGEAGVKLAYSQEQQARQNQVSPDLVATNQWLTAQRTGRDIRSGAAQGASYDELAKGIDRFEESIRPLTDILNRIQNTLAADIVNAVTDVIEVLKSLPGVSAVINAAKADAERKSREGMGGLLADKQAQFDREQAAARAMKEAQQRAIAWNRRPGR